MGLYADHVVPRVSNVACNTPATRRRREEVCAGLHGTVVELGFGSGLNVPHYPPAVTQVEAVEPSTTAWRLAARRLQDSPVPVRRSGLDGQRLPYEDESADTALSTWTLCTIPDAVAAIREVRRVLRPGGSLHFVEHGAAPDERVLRWQHRLTPVQRRVAGGCHLDRDIADLLAAGGFRTTDLEVFYEEGAPKVLGATSLGVAVAA
jgi:ubiquinone/menaquinone biosynthesis C-methylase UbiE